MKKNSLGSVKLDRVLRMIASLEKSYKGSPQKVTEMDLSFEYVVGSLFPMAVKNMENNLNIEHTKGYLEGIKAKSNLDSNFKFKNQKSYNELKTVNKQLKLVDKELRKAKHNISDEDKTVLYTISNMVSQLIKMTERERK